MELAVQEEKETTEANNPNAPDSTATIPEESIKNIGEYLHCKRQEKKLSLRNLAQKANISYTELHRIENGKSFPTVSTLRKLAPYISVAFDELLLTAGYSFEAEGDDAIYLDLQGNTIDLFEKALKFYTQNVELFFLFEKWMEHCPSEDETFVSQILSLLILENEYKKKESQPLNDEQSNFLSFMNGIRYLTKSCNLLTKDNLLSEKTPEKI